MSAMSGASKASSSTNSPSACAHSRSALELLARQHAQDHQHAAGTRGARLEHLVGIDQKVLAHGGHGERRERRGGGARCASEPSKRSGSVSTETAAAPARA